MKSCGNLLYSIFYSNDPISSFFFNMSCQLCCHDMGKIRTYPAFHLQVTETSIFLFFFFFFSLKRLRLSNQFNYNNVPTSGGDVWQAYPNLVYSQNNICICKKMFMQRMVRSTLQYRCPFPIQRLTLKRQNNMKTIFPMVILLLVRPHFILHPSLCSPFSLLVRLTAHTSSHNSMTVWSISTIHNTAHHPSGSQSG